eukprot:scaffold23011_cov58-Skeletonema_dohrnii-CCMP3373.AAC.1
MHPNRHIALLPDFESKWSFRDIVADAIGSRSIRKHDQQPLLIFPAIDPRDGATSCRIIPCHTPRCPPLPVICQASAHRG